MINQYKTYNCRILKIENEGSNCQTYILSLPYKKFSFEPGQYVMVSLPGFGEAAISIASDMSQHKVLELMVRKCGTLSSELANKKKGDLIGIRGPYGKPYPLEKALGKDILMVVGGTGIPAVRPIIMEVLKNPKKYKKVSLFYGAKDENALIYTKEYAKWGKFCEVNVALENPRSKKCFKGMVTGLFDIKEISADTVAFVCGPPIMYKFVVEKMLANGMKPENIYLSLERHMDCGQGVCQHCAVGGCYVCKDGPVFSYAELNNFKSWLSPI